MRHVLHRVAAALTSVLLAVGILIATAVPAVACSCVGPQPMAAYAGEADQVIFTGVVQPPDGRGVPVRVTRWFQGQGPTATAFVRLAGDGFGGDGASCGTPLPAAGTEWIFVAYRSPDGPDLGVNLCTPHASANTAEGRAMFADAIATFGDGLVLDPGPAAPTKGVEPGNEADVLAIALAVASTVVVAIALGLAGRMRRRQREPAGNDPA